MYKKFHILIILLFVLFMANPLSLKAQEISKIDTRGVVSVVGTASENLSPDMATIILSVETTSKNAQEAATSNSIKADKVVCAMKKLLKPELGDTIKTTSYTLQPVYEYDNSRKKTILTGYTASNQLTIITKQISNVGNFLDSAIASGANQVQNISFQLTKNNESCKRLLIKATTNAKDQALVVAQTLGVKILGVKQVSTNCGSEQPYPRMYGFSKSMMAESAPSTPIESGEVKFNANVNIDFYVY